MPKKPVVLDDLLNTAHSPSDTGIPQRGTGLHDGGRKDRSPKRDGEKRLTLALDGATYKRLRLYAVETDQTHQKILETALTEFLKRANA